MKFRSPIFTLLACSVFHLAPSFAQSTSISDQMTATSTSVVTGKKRLINEETLLLFRQGFEAFQNKRFLEIPALLRKAHEIAEEANDKPGQAIALFGQAEMYRKLGIQSKYESLSQEARALLAAEAPSVRAGVLSMYGAACSMAGLTEQGIQLCQEAVQLAQKAGDAKTEGEARFLLAWIYRLNAEGQKSLTETQLAEKLQRASNDNDGLAWTLLNKGYLFEGVLHREGALECFQEALTLLRSSRARAQHQDSALGFFRSLLYDEKMQESRLLMGIGIAMMRQSQSKGIPYFEEALQVSQTLKYRYFESRVLQILALCYNGMGQSEKAIATLERALLLSREMGSKTSEAVILENLGALYLQEKNMSRNALDVFRSSLKIQRELGYVSPQLIHSLGSLELATGNMLEAGNFFREAVEKAESKRTGLGSLTDSKMADHEGNLRYYSSYIRWLLENKRPNDAFLWTEKTKARALIDLMENGRVQVLRGATNEEKTRMAELRTRADALNRQLVAEQLNPVPDAGNLEAVQSELRNAEAELRDYTEKLYALYPELAQQRAASTITLEETARLLTPGTVLLNYVALREPDKMVLFAVSNFNGQLSVEAFDLNIDLEQIAELVEDFREACTNPEGKYRAKARSLYEDLVAPASKVLEDARHVVICPDGPLWGLPFQALMPDSNNFALQRWDISYAFSATAAHAAATSQERKRDRSSIPTPNSLLVLANPDFGGAQRFVRILDQTRAITTGSRAIVAGSRAIEAGSRAIAADSRAITADARSVGLPVSREGGIAPLPGTQLEADALQRAFPEARILSGTQAQESTLRNDMKSFKYLHFATHGLLNENAPLLSSIVLAQPKDDAQDGFLTAREIFDLDLQADLAVLSACNTGRGQQRGGEGVVGLTWAFFVAGVPTQVVSQWAVNDASTAELMQGFYAQLKKGQNSTQALRTAGLALLNSPTYKHPYYWAPFIVIGNWKN